MQNMNRPRYGTRETEIPLNFRQCFEVFQALTHSTSQAIVEVIMKELYVGNGLTMLINGIKTQMSEAFADYKCKNYDPLVLEGFKCMLTLGIVPVIFESSCKYGLGPDEMEVYVPAFGTYVITTYFEKCKQRFALYDSVGNLIPNSYVLHDFGFNPDIRGNLRSKMFAALADINCLTEIQSLALRAERVNSLPPLLTEYNPAAGMESSELDVGELWGGASGMSLVNRKEEQTRLLFDRDEEQKELQRRNLLMQARMLNTNPEDYARVKDKSLHNAADKQIAVEAINQHGHEMPWANKLNLATTERLNTQLRSYPRTDFVQIVELLTQRIYDTMGIDRKALSSSTSARSGAQFALRNLTETVDMWGKKLSLLVTTVFHECFTRNFITRRFNIHVKDRRSKHYVNPLVSEDELAQMKEQTSTVFVFDLQPTCSHEDLRSMYLDGVIEFETYSSAARRISNLSSHIEDVVQDKYTWEERKQMNGAIPRKKAKPDETVSTTDTN